MKFKLKKLSAFLSRHGVGARVLSLFLSVVMLFYVIPTVIYAEVADALSAEESAEADESAASSSGSTAASGELYEVEALREESVKHFRLEDGSYIAAQYAAPVHYMDEDGAWQDIDNVLAEDSGGEISTSNARVRFAKKTTGSGKLLTLKDSDYRVTMSVIGGEKGIAGTVTNGTDARAETELQKLMNLEKLSASVLYENVFSGVDLEYVVSSWNIKENIIVKEKQDSYSYSFELKLNGLDAALLDSGDVLLTDSDTGDTVYTLPAPFAYDSNDAIAPEGAVYYTLSGSGNKYTLTVTADSEWMNSEERFYPITVDPPMMSTSGSVDDFNINSASPDSNTDNTENVYVSSTERAYIKFDENYFASIPVGMSVMKAELNLFGYYEESDTAKVGAYAVTADWDNTLTWNKTIAATPQGSFSGSALDYVTVSNNGARYNWNITALYKSWLNGSSNYGIGLRLVDEASDERVYFKSYEYSPSDGDSNFYKPVIMVTYVQADGLESYYPTASHSAGVGGTGSINLSTGRLTLAIPTLTATDSLFAFTPTLVYNGSLAGKAATSENVCSAFATSYMPNGFKLNVQETIIAKSYLDENNVAHTYYVLYDSDGTAHNFYSSGTANVYRDDDGLRLTMTIESNNITVKDTSHTAKTYSSVGNSSWHLTSVSDVSGNKLIFEFNTSYQPTRVLVKPYGLSEIEMLNLLYESNKLCAIYNSSSKDSVILRYSGGNLVAVQYCYGNDSTTEQNVRDTYLGSASAVNVTVYATASYTYDSNGYITAITDSDTSRSLRYEITGGKITKLSEYAGSTLGQQISYTYGEGYTEARSTGNDETLGTSDDIITRHIFDSYGRAVSVYSSSSDGSEIYGATTGTYETQENVKNNLNKQVVLGGSAVNYLLNGGFEYGTTHWSVSETTASTYEVHFEGEGRQCLEFSPTASQSAYATQRVKLRSGSYTLSMLVGARYCSGYTGSVKIVNADTEAAIHSKNISLNTIANTADTSYFTTGFEIESASEFTTVDLIIEFTTSTVNSSAEIQIDRVMLENHVGSADYSLVEYGSFDATTIDPDLTTYALSSEWGATATVVSDESPFNNVLKITSDSSGKITQRVFMASLSDLTSFDQSYNNEDGNNDGHEYIVSAFAKSQSALASSNTAFRIVVSVAYYQGSGKDNVVLTYEYDFVPDCNGWQFVCGHVPTAKENTSTAKYNCIKYIDVTCEYSGQLQGYALFDNVSFIYATGDNLAENYYDADGNLIATISYDYEEYYHYNDNNDVTKIINNQNELTEYVYDASRPGVASSVTDYTYSFKSGQSADYLNESLNDIIDKSKKTATSYTYDSYGLCTSMKVKQYDDSGNEMDEYIGETYAYITDSGSKIFGALSYSISLYDHRTSYIYDQNNGRLLLIGYPDTTAIAYAYDDAGRLIKVSPAYYNYTYDDQTVSSSSNVEYSYNDSNLPIKITTESTEYIISYNAYGASSGISIGERELASYEYYENNGKLKKVTYGNGFIEEYVYNTLENLSEIWYTTSDRTKALAYSYEYTSYGQLSRIIDNISGNTTVFRYDVNGRVISSGQYEGGEYELFSEYSYDELSRLSASVTNIYYLVGSTKDNETIRCEYSYNSAGSLNVFWTYDTYINYTYDPFSRLTAKKIEHTASGNTPTYTNEITYGYKSNVDHTSNYIDEYISKVNGTTTASFTYEYDKLGNITKITDIDGNEIRYYYEALNVLARVENEITSKTYVYRYDSAGNVTSIETSPLTDGSSGGGSDDDNPNEYALQLPVVSTTTTIPLTYTDSEWGDLLSSYNGTAITYDSIGNPLSYYNGTSYTFTWTGRRLTGAVKGTNTMSFTYNDEGLRTSKTVNGATTTYLYDGGMLVAEYAPSYTCVYIYDESGSIMGARYISTAEGSTWQTYFFEKNLQGDVITVYSDTGTKLISYSYDAWGKTTTSFYNSGSITLAANNRITYRGYYYDSSLGMYYLQSRYYDPNTCRFISPDTAAVLTATPTQLTDKNLYAYCDNNPVMRVDGNGEFWHVIVGAAIGAIAGIVSTAISDVLGGENVYWEKYFVAAVSGAITGAVSASGVSLGLMVSVNAVMGASESVVQDLIKNEKGFSNYGFDQIAGHALINAGISALSSYISGVGNGKQMNQMFKESQAATKALTAGGVNPHVKKGLTTSINRYYKQLGKNIVGGIKDIGFTTAPFACEVSFLTTCYDALFR